VCNEVTGRKCHTSYLVSRMENSFLVGSGFWKDVNFPYREGLCHGAVVAPDVGMLLLCFA
jgi:hypothetical protein